MGNVLTSTDSRMLLTLTEAAESVGYSPDTLRRATKATDPSKFPPPLKRGTRTTRWRSGDISAWLKSGGQAA